MSQAGNDRECYPDLITFSFFPILSPLNPKCLGCFLIPSKFGLKKKIKFTIILSEIFGLKAALTSELEAVTQILSAKIQFSVWLPHKIMCSVRI